MSPQRIQLRRTRGWRKPEGAVVVSRPGKWGNPWRVGDVATARFPDGSEREVTLWADLAVVLFRASLEAGLLPFSVADARAELAGRDLACWCRPGEPCHGDVLLELVNE